MMPMAKPEEELITAAKEIIRAQIDNWHAAWLRLHPHSSGPLYQLTELTLDHSGLRYLPPQVVLAALPCLQVLSLRDNKLRSLHGGLKSCHCLTKLKLDGNYLTTLKNELRALHCLRYLSAQSNVLGNLKVNEEVIES